MLCILSCLFLPLTSIPRSVYGTYVSSLLRRLYGKKLRKNESENMYPQQAFLDQRSEVPML